METIAKIRLLYFTKKKTVSEIARLVRMSRNTVYKYLHHDGDV
ncbi:helix-turn-helix domain-containing protein, partial [Acidithiobacillus caldus]